jgi:acyl-CoA synthetase (AMP-forming)/AMP-acid ligase II
LTPRVGRFRADALALKRVVDTGDEGLASREVVSCGRIVAEFDVAIVNPETMVRCAADEVGEIWVCDPSVARGYWRRDDETETTFRAYIADTGEGPFLRTGDLGFIQDRELFVTSRIKDLIIVAGANHYPQDIEWTVEQCHPDVRPSGVAAFSIAVDGDERLVVAAEIERGSIDRPDATAVILDAIKKSIAEEHEVPVHAVLLLARGSLPKTASGKVQRHGCWRLLEAESSDVLASWIAGTTRRAQPASSN